MMSVIINFNIFCLTFSSETFLSNYITESLNLLSNELETDQINGKQIFAKVTVHEVCFPKLFQGYSTIYHSYNFECKHLQCVLPLHVIFPHFIINCWPLRVNKLKS